MPEPPKTAFLTRFRPGATSPAPSPEEALSVSLFTELRGVRQWAYADGRQLARELTVRFAPLELDPCRRARFLGSSPWRLPVLVIDNVAYNGSTCGIGTSAPTLVVYRSGAQAGWTLAVNWPLQNLAAAYRDWPAPAVEIDPPLEAGELAPLLRARLTAVGSDADLGIRHPMRLIVDRGSLGRVVVAEYNRDDSPRVTGGADRLTGEQPMFSVTAAQVAEALSGLPVGTYVLTLVIYDADGQMTYAAECHHAEISADADPALPPPPTSMRSLGERTASQGGSYGVFESCRVDVAAVRISGFAGDFYARNTAGDAFYLTRSGALEETDAPAGPAYWCGAFGGSSTLTWEGATVYFGDGRVVDTDYIVEAAAWGLHAGVPSLIYAAVVGSVVLVRVKPGGGPEHTLAQGAPEHTTASRYRRELLFSDSGARLAYLCAPVLDGAAFTNGIVSEAVVPLDTPPGETAVLSWAVSANPGAPAVGDMVVESPAWTDLPPQIYSWQQGSQPFDQSGRRHHHITYSGAARLLVGAWYVGEELSLAQYDVEIFGEYEDLYDLEYVQSFGAYSYLLPACSASVPPIVPGETVRDRVQNWSGETRTTWVVQVRDLAPGAVAMTVKDYLDRRTDTKRYRSIERADVSHPPDRPPCRASTAPVDVVEDEPQHVRSVRVRERLFVSLPPSPVVASRLVLAAGPSGVLSSDSDAEPIVSSDIASELRVLAVRGAEAGSYVADTTWFSPSNSLPAISYPTTPEAVLSRLNAEIIEILSDGSSAIAAHWPVPAVQHRTALGRTLCIDGNLPGDPGRLTVLVPGDPSECLPAVDHPPIPDWSAPPPARQDLLTAINDRRSAGGAGVLSESLELHAEAAALAAALAEEPADAELRVPHAHQLVAAAAADAELAVLAWMGSARHRARMLDAMWSRVGLAVDDSDNHGLIYVAVFGIET